MSGNAICRSVNGAVDFVNAKFGNIKEDIFKDKNYTKYIDTANTKGEYDEATATVKFEITTSGAKYKGDNKAGAFTIAIDVDAVTGKITNYNILIDGSTGASFTQKMEKVIKPDGNYIFVGMDLEAVINFLNNGIELEYPGDNKGTPISSGASQSVTPSAYTPSALQPKTTKFCSLPLKNPTATAKRKEVAKMNKFKKITLDGLIYQNPTFMLVLGTCPTLGLISSAFSSMGMGLTV